MLYSNKLFAILDTKNYAMQVENLKYEILKDLGSGAFGNVLLIKLQTPKIELLNDEKTPLNQPTQLSQSNQLYAYKKINIFHNLREVIQFKLRKISPSYPLPPFEDKKNN